MGVTAALTLLIPEAAKLGGYEASDYPYYLVAIRSAGHIHYALGIFFLPKVVFYHFHSTSSLHDYPNQWPKTKDQKGVYSFFGIIFFIFNVGLS